MPDIDEAHGGDDFQIDTAPPLEKFFLKGSNSLDWGMKNRLARIFSPISRRSVMLAVDHGYFQGPTTGLERIDLTIPPLVAQADALMITRGALRACIPPEMSKPVVLRVTGGQSVLKELSNELVAVDIEDAVRVNASAMAAQVYIGGEYEHQSIGNLIKVVDEGLRRGIPTLAVTGVGKQLLGASAVKTYFCEENFARVTASCPVPVLIAGGKKLPERDALRMANLAIEEGAAGVDMGRNIFQADAPLAMLQAVRAVVHAGESPEKAYDLYLTLKSQAAARLAGEK
jgi:3-hydroxy-5-phosphonooxypentane-2,4-dione thiolase